MSDCSGLPTQQTARTFNQDAVTTNEMVTLEQDRTNPASDGKTKKTMWGIENDATLQRENIENLAEAQRQNIDATFTAQFAYKRIGNISAYVGDTLQEADKLNSYQHPDDSGEWYGPVQSQAFPITIPANPASSNDWALVNALTTSSLPEISILDCGMSGDPGIDESDLFIDALSKNHNLYIPKGSTVKITKPIPLFNNTLRVDGLIDQYHDGIGLHVMYGSKLIGGVDAYHMRRMSPTFSSDLACCVLLYRNDSGGCIENKVNDFVVINGFIDFSSDPQGILDPTKCEGKAFWLLAGDTHGIASKAAYESTYRNHFTNCRADGFEYDLILEADTATLGTDRNGWVNGNTFVNFSSRRCKHQIYITCPLENADGKLLGECSGNFFKNVDIQYSGGLFEDSIYCEGRNNVFDIMQWDTPEDKFPIVKFDKRDKTLGYGYATPSGNVVSITGSSASLENRGVYEVDPGFNAVMNSSRQYDNVFPVSPLGSGQREDQSYIGVVENYLGLGDNLESLVVEKLNSTESKVGEITVLNQDRMFDPEQESYASIPVDTETYGVNIVINLKGSTNHIAYSGLVIAYKEFVSGTVDFDFYNSSGSKLATVYSDLTRDSSINTGKQNITGVKTVRIKIRVPQTGTLIGNMDINNLFCKVYNKRNDWYHCRRDQDEKITGDYTFDGNTSFNGSPVFNTKPRLGSGGEFYGDMESLDSSRGIILKSPNGTRYRLKVSNSGALSTEAV